MAVVVQCLDDGPAILEFVVPLEMVEEQEEFFWTALYVVVAFRDRIAVLGGVAAALRSAVDADAIFGRTDVLRPLPRRGVIVVLEASSPLYIMCIRPMPPVW